MEQANSIDKYLHILNRYSAYTNIYFRGQLEKHQTMPPSIAREDGHRDNESKMYNDALNMACNDFTGLNLPIEKLSKMQHYGIPTRLVDVTIDPLIALFFAVQNSDDESAGNVYVYLPKEYDLDSKEAKALSLLATIEPNNIENLCKAYFKEYCEHISIDEICDLISNPIFIKYCDRLQNSNNRLFNQKGTFVICSNQLQDNRILPNLISLDTVTYSIVIRIPYEYKEYLKNELDEKHNINETTVYPELPSVANYLKAKYKKANRSVDGAFSVIEEKDVNTVFAKRISIIITITKLLTIDQIKVVAVDAIKRYQKSHDVVWLYVAKNGDDYIMRNWIFRAQWINPTLDKKYRPLTLKENENDKYYYECNESYSTLSEYYLKHIFQDDKLLLVGHKKNLDNVYSAFLEILKANNTDDIIKLKSLIATHQKSITKAFFINSDFGHSRNAAFDEYLNLYDSLFWSLDNLHLRCENDSLNERSLKYQLNSCIADVKKYIDLILSQHEHWESELGVDADAYKNIDIDVIKKDEYQYTQTIPINEAALEVEFDEVISINEDNTFSVSGKTNLFDDAVLMLSIRDDKGKLHSQGKATVLNGLFQFSKMSKKGNGYLAGTYKGNISLSLPSVQPKTFSAKAGIEYENLTGTYVNRIGIGPTVEYEFSFQII